MKTMIDAEFEKFFEFPTADRAQVTSVSCKLFARHMIETERKVALTTDRERFEKIISKSPYELLINRYPNNHTSGWPDAYKDYKVQLCWDVCQDFAAPLRDEIARLTQCLQKANAQAARFEREWYLRGDEIERLRNALQRLIDVAEQCDSWESFPSKALEDAEKALGDSNDH